MNYFRPKKIVFIASKEKDEVESLEKDA